MSGVLPWVVGALGGGWAALHVAVTLGDRQRRRRGPALLAEAQGHITAHAWRAAAGCLRAALPHGVTRRDAVRVREIVRLAKAIDHGQLRELFPGAHALTSELERLDRDGGAVPGLGELERFLRRTAAGHHDATARDQAPPLIRALLADDDAAVDALLDSGASADARDAHGTSAVSHAIEAATLAVVQRLVRARGLLDHDEQRALLHRITTTERDAVDAAARWLARWLADQPGFEVHAASHATQLTLGAWAADVGETALATRLRAHGDGDADLDLDLDD